ncbi:MAG TPA: hypothetical protein P5262_04705 [Candidatus Moranbacteria bacterium]|nr:hypothetical protein [Candidatus Moranbacteria bacterium]
MGDDKKKCNCDCGCGHGGKLPEDKVEDLKDALKKLGYKLEETEDGEIKVTK